MAEEQAASLEEALARTEREAEAALKSAARVTGALKALQKAAQIGETRKIRAAPEAIRQNLAALDHEVARLAGSWTFDEESWLRDGGFVDELLREAARQGVHISYQDERLYCYPMLISVAPAERAVRIDKKPERSIRPSVLVALLRARQGQQPRFKPAAFLDSLHAAYAIAIDRKSRHRHSASVVSLRELHEMLTMMPGAARDYSLAEFTRDIYLLDQSGELTTKNGATMEFHASTGTKSERGTLSIVTQTGAEKRYFGVSFSKGD